MRPRDHVAGKSAEPSRSCLLLSARRCPVMRTDANAPDEQPSGQLQDAGHRDGGAADHPAQREDRRVGGKEVADGVRGQFTVEVNFPKPLSATMRLK